MKRSLSLFFTLAVCGLATTSRAGILLDDFFTLGNRTTQTLPTSSAWFANGNGATLTNAVGSMTGVPPGSSCMWMTYFMPPGMPSALAIGDTLQLTIVFTAYGVSPSGNNGRNLRMGLFNYSAGGTRITADGFSTGGGNGANVLGYGAFVNFGQIFGVNNPISITKRTTTSDSNLLGTSGDYTTLLSGGGSAGDPGITNGVQYTMTLSVTRNDVDAVTITNRFFSTNGVDFSTVATDSSGTVTNFDCFAMRPANTNGFTMYFVVTEFRVDGPQGLATAPSITTSPADQTVTVSDFTMLSVAAAGATPLHYQWYFNNAAAPLANKTNAILLLTNIQSSQAGQYFAVVTNVVGSATSAPANLTVTTPIHTPVGLVLDDFFTNSSRGGVSVTSSNSAWVASVETTLVQDMTAGSMLGTVQANTSTLWIGSFVDWGATAPIDLAVGTELKTTLVFYPTNVAAQNTGSLRLGLFDFFDGATFQYIYGDGNLSTPSWNGSGAGAGARGYMLTLNFGTTFGDATPLGFYVRTNLPSAGLMSSAGDFLSLDSGPSGMSNSPAFADGTQYTLALTVARVADSQALISAQVSGGQLSHLYFAATDPTYFTHRFSALGIRPNRITDSAGNFNFTELKVEVLPVPPPIVPFPITAQTFSRPNQFSLTWNSVAGKYYQVQSAPSLSPPAWVTAAVVTATGSVTSWTNSSAANPAAFYRVLAPLQP